MKYNYIEDVVNRTVDELHTCDPFEIAKKLILKSFMNLYIPMA
jgi:hypothetical protein